MTLKKIISKAKKKGFHNIVVIDNKGFQNILQILDNKKVLATIIILNDNKIINKDLLFKNELYFEYKTYIFSFTDGYDFYVFNRFNKPSNSKKLKIDDFFDLLTDIKNNKDLNNIKDNIYSIFKNKINEKSDEFSSLNEFINNNDIKKQFISELKMDSNYNFFFENNKNDLSSFEHKFFLKLLGNEVPQIIYRYMSFERMFKTFENNKIAMLGLTGMNDKTEPNYIDNYLNNNSKNPVWKMPHQSITAINRRFIMSCTKLKDDLLQWRLYGDNGKGVCISFDTKNYNNNNHFYLGIVKYADESGKHPELELIKEIIIEIRKKLIINIKFILLYVWRHFFKPNEYKYEQEIRLLYIEKNKENKKWIITKPYNIINPLVEFELDDEQFPLTIKEITFGPLLTEKELNAIQLKQMLGNKKLKINQSKKTVYR